MENNSNWNHNQDDYIHQDYTQHPTGAHFAPPDIPGNVPHKFVTYPHHLSDLQNDLENDYPTNSQQANGRNEISTSDDNPVMGSENSFDSFDDTDPNRYNNNAGLGFKESSEQGIINFADENTNEIERKHFLSDDFESNEFDGNSENDDNYPKHPEF